MRFHRRPSHPAYCQVRPFGRACGRRTVWLTTGFCPGEGPSWSCGPCTLRLERSWGAVLVARP
jgi:hypothetical protein